MGKKFLKSSLRRLSLLAGSLPLNSTATVESLETEDCCRFTRKREFNSPLDGRRSEGGHRYPTGLFRWIGDKLHSLGGNICYMGLKLRSLSLKISISHTRWERGRESRVNR